MSIKFFCASLLYMSMVQGKEVSKKGRQHLSLSPLDCLSAKPDGATNGGRSPFILTVDWIG